MCIRDRDKHPQAPANFGIQVPAVPAVPASTRKGAETRRQAYRRIQAGAYRRAGVGAYVQAHTCRRIRAGAGAHIGPIVHLFYSVTVGKLAHVSTW